MLVAAGWAPPPEPPPDHEPERIARSIFLGQAYPSGMLYLEAFRGVHDDAAPEWPEEVAFVPLDAGFPGSARTPGQEPRARLGSVGEWINPPAEEGMLAPGSPCAPAGYAPRDGAVYAPAGPPGDHEGPRSLWEAGEYFATNEWFGCAVEPTVPIYESREPGQLAHRVVAFDPELRIVALDRSVVGTPRTMTGDEQRRVAERRAGAPCTLEPRDLDEAVLLLAFGIEGSRYDGRISSYVAACTSLAEVFLLDLLEEEEVVASFEISRWRGHP